MKSFLVSIAREIGLALHPLYEAMKSRDSLLVFFAELGWDIETMPPSISNLATTIGSAYTLSKELEDGDASQQIIVELRSVFNSISSLSQASDLTPEMRAELPEQLFQYLLVERLLSNHQRVGAILEALGLIRSTIVSAAPDVGRLSYTRKLLTFSEFQLLFSQPMAFFKQTFEWGDTRFRGEAWCDSLFSFMEANGFAGSVYFPSDQQLAFLSAGTIEPAAALMEIPRITLYNRDRPGGRCSINLGLFPLLQTDMDAPGFSVVLSLEGGLSETMQIRPGFNLEMTNTLNSEVDICAIIRPNKDIQFVNFETGDPLDLTGEVTFLFSHASSHPILFGGADSTRLEIRTITTQCGLRTNNQNNTELFTEFYIQQGKLIIQPSDGDALIGKILPPGGITVPFELKIGFSDTRGMYISGGAGFAYQFQVNKQLGPIFVRTVDLNLFANTEGINLVTALTGGAEIGPVTAVVEEIGLKTQVIFGRPGLLGKADLDFAFKLPSAIGLSIQSSGLRGGGFLQIESPNYGGMLQISYENKFDLTVYCLISTKLPGGRDGFSMFIQVMATFSPVQLGLGFALIGVGGLFGFNRALNVNALKVVAKNHTLDALMFAEDPVKDASLIIDSIRDIYPADEGKHTLGFFGKFIWGGTIKIAEFNLGVIIPLGGQPLMVIVGTAKSKLPSDINPMLKLNMDVFGQIDFGNESLSVDLTLLNGSQLQKIDLEGEMALRSSWAKSSRNFAMSAGGWYPRFRHIPANFPSLKKMSGKLQKSGIKLTLKTYLAVTTNTIQSGASLELWGKKSGFTITGRASYDAIFIFRPFSFECVINFRVRAEKGPISAGVELEFKLSGPNPYRASGYAKFKVTCKTFKVRFTKTFGDEVPDPLPTISPKQRLLAELSNPKCIHHEMPVAVSSNFIFVSNAEEKLDPVADVVISQTVVPLNYTMARFGGGKPPSSEQKLTIDVGSGGDFRDSFALEQYNAWSKDEKMSAPPYEDLKAGKRCPGEYVTWSPGVTWPQREIMFETVLRESDEYRPAEPKTYKLIRNRKIIGGAELGYLSAWSKFGSAHYHKPMQSGRLEKHKNFLNIGTEVYTVSTQHAIDGKFERTMLDGSKAGDMTYTEAMQLVSLTRDPDVVVRNADETMSP